MKNKFIVGLSIFMFMLLVGSVYAESEKDFLRDLLEELKEEQRLLSEEIRAGGGAAPAATPDTQPATPPMPAGPVPETGTRQVFEGNEFKWDGTRWKLVSEEEEEKEKSGILGKAKEAFSWFKDIKWLLALLFGGAAATAVGRAIYKRKKKKAPHKEEDELDKAIAGERFKLAEILKQKIALVKHIREHYRGIEHGDRPNQTIKYDIANIYRKENKKLIFAFCNDVNNLILINKKLLECTWKIPRLESHELKLLARRYKDKQISAEEIKVLINSHGCMINGELLSQAQGFDALGEKEQKLISQEMVVMNKIIELVNKFRDVLVQEDKLIMEDDGIKANIDNVWGTINERGRVNVPIVRKTLNSFLEKIGQLVYIIQSAELPLYEEFQEDRTIGAKIMKMFEELKAEKDELKLDKVKELVIKTYVNILKRERIWEASLLLKIFNRIFDFKLEIKLGDLIDGDSNVLINKIIKIIVSGDIRYYLIINVRENILTVARIGKNSDNNPDSTGSRGMEFDVDANDLILKLEEDKSTLPTASVPPPAPTAPVPPPAPPETPQFELRWPKGDGKKEELGEEDYVWKENDCYIKVSDIDELKQKITEEDGNNNLNIIFTQHITNKISGSFNNDFSEWISSSLNKSEIANQVNSNLERVEVNVTNAQEIKLRLLAGLDDREYTEDSEISDNIKNKLTGLRPLSYEHATNDNMLNYKESETFLKWLIGEINKLSDNDIKDELIQKLNAALRELNRAANTFDDLLLIKKSWNFYFKFLYEYYEDKEYQKMLTRVRD